MDAIYVLSVKSFDDRHAHIRREMRKAGLQFEFIFKFDADEINATHPILSRAHLSLIRKHQHAWQRVCDENLSSALIVEDDVILRAGFVDRLREIEKTAAKLKPGWLVFLGGADHKVSNAFFGYGGILVEHPNSTAEAYLTDQAACRKRLSWLNRNAVDLPADHLIRLIDQEMDIKQHWPREALVTQGSVTGRFRTTLDHGR